MFPGPPGHGARPRSALSEALRAPSGPVRPTGAHVPHPAHRLSVAPMMDWTDFGILGV